MDVKNEGMKTLGDGGDSQPLENRLCENVSGFDGPVCELVQSLKNILQCGDHNGLQQHLAKLKSWNLSEEREVNHNYWRVAQYIGETELGNLMVLVTVTSEGGPTWGWECLEDTLTLLSMCLCNREIIFKLLYYSDEFLSNLTLALANNASKLVISLALKIISLAIIVCRARFARSLLNSHLLDDLLDYWEASEPMKSLTSFEMCLQVIKSLLMCGQNFIFIYTRDILEQLNGFLPAMSAQNCDESEVLRLMDFYNELMESIDGDKKAHVCAKYWTRGRLRKELLRESLGQPWLYIYCSWPPCGINSKNPEAFFRKCSACNVVRYCSRQCQIDHWTTLHKTECSLISTHK